MIVPGAAPRIVLATRPVDFRKGHDALAALVEHELGLDPFSGVVVVFRPKRADRVKVLWRDGTGLVLASNASNGAASPGPRYAMGWCAFLGRSSRRCSRVSTGAGCGGRGCAVRLRRHDRREVRIRIVACQGSDSTIVFLHGFEQLGAVDLASLAPPLQALFAGQQATVEALRAEVASLADQNRRLEHLLDELRRAIFGKKSEKRHPDQLLLAFEALEGALAEAEQAAPAGTTPTPRAKRLAAERNLGHLPAHLPRTCELIEPESTQRPCGCGEMVKIGEDRTERLHIVPAQLQVIVTVRPKYACRSCEEGVTQASAPAHLIEGGLPTEGLLAHVLARSSRTICRCIANRRSSPARASTCTARHWPSGSARRRSTLGPCSSA